ncbi:MAG: Maf family protein [Verrucomicrobiota bacterium]
MGTLRLVLASASPRRVELMRESGWVFETVVSGVEELEFHPEGPEALALENARRKWESIAAIRPQDMVVSADTVVWMDGDFYAKPRDLTHARKMLGTLSGKTHKVVTGVFCGRKNQSRSLFAETSHVTFHALSPAAIEDYIGLVNPLDKAGGYAAQGEGGKIISRLEGSLTNVIGLPIERLSAELLRLGMQPQSRHV